MALSGKTNPYYFITSNRNIYVFLEWSVLSQNVMDSSSEVVVSAYLHTNTDITMYGADSGGNSLRVSSYNQSIVNPEDYPNPWSYTDSWTQRTVIHFRPNNHIKGEDFLLRQFTCSVQHLIDGTVSARIGLNIGYRIGTGVPFNTPQYTIDIESIDRSGKIIQKELTDDQFVLSFVPTWNLENGYTYDYETASISGASEPISFTLERHTMFSTYTLVRDKEEWYSDFPTSISNIYNIEVTQKKNDESSQSVIQEDMVITIPEDSAPVIDTDKITIESSEDYGFVQKYTRAYVIGDYDGDFCTVRHGSELADIYITCEGKQSWFDARLPGDPVVQPPVAMTSLFEGHGDIPITITATDSRGLTSTATTMVHVSQYVIPSLTNISVYRSRADGTPDDDAGENISVKCDFTGCVDGILAHDACICTVETSSYILQSGVRCNISGISTTSGYDVVITIQDRVGNSASFRTRVPTVYATFNAMRGGHGFAFGKMAETNDMLDVAWDIRTEGKLIVKETEMTEDDLKNVKKFDGVKFADLDTRVGNAERTIEQDSAKINAAETKIQALEKATSVQVDRYSELSYNSAFEAYPGHEPMVTRVGCFVFLDGMIRAKSSKASSSDVLMATLPDWARPRVRVNQLMQGSSANVWWLEIYPDGTVCATRYRSTNSTSYASIASGAQLPITACWIAADAYPG